MQTQESVVSKTTLGSYPEGASMECCVTGVKSDTRAICVHDSKEKNFRGAWVARSVKRPASAQVMVSHFVSSSPASGSVLTAQSLEPASDSVSPSLSAPPLLVLSLSRK